MKCPKCGNLYCDIITQSQTTGTDYSICKGLLGEAFCGTSGFICGFSDSREKNVEAFWKCRKCGFSFKG